MSGVPTVRCHQCGRRIPEDGAVRRNVRAPGLVGTKSRVDLCPDCADRARAVARGYDVASLVVLGLIAALLLAFGLMALGVYATRH